MERGEVSLAVRALILCAALVLYFVRPFAGWGGLFTVLPAIVAMPSWIVGAHSTERLRFEPMHPRTGGC